MCNQIIKDNFTQLSRIIYGGQLLPEYSNSNYIKDIDGFYDKIDELGLEDSDQVELIKQIFVLKFGLFNGFILTDEEVADALAITKEMVKQNVVNTCYLLKLKEKERINIRYNISNQEIDSFKFRPKNGIKMVELKTIEEAKVSYEDYNKTKYANNRIFGGILKRSKR